MKKIIIGFICIVFLAGCGNKNINNDAMDFIQDTKNKIEDKINNADTDFFNSNFEKYNGIKSGVFVIDMLEKISTNNQKNDKKITVIYDNISTTSANDILDITDLIDNSEDYKVLFDYDNNGYINKVTIQKK